jgi:DNA-binding transcriptional regulator YiaG
VKDFATKAEYIKKRAEGLSHEIIASSLGVSRATLFNWDRELAVSSAISELQANRIQELKEQFVLSQQKRREQFISNLEALEKEVTNRNLAEIDTAKLLDVYIKANSLVQKEDGGPNVLIVEKQVESQSSLPDGVSLKDLERLLKNLDKQEAENKAKN